MHVRNNAIPFALYFKKWLVGMVASLFDEDVVNHEILVLTGRQDIYKTSWLNNLLVPELRRYFYLKSNARRRNPLRSSVGRHRRALPGHNRHSIGICYEGGLTAALPTHVHRRRKPRSWHCCAS